ncbi:RDD family protein [Snodgrassella sp. CS2]|uniref:RDD family protein n=1 Tax=Snodgrassella sp. CS2 TaxID=3418953 RepID=UPI003D0224A1
MQNKSNMKIAVSDLGISQQSCPALPKDGLELATPALRMSAVMINQVITSLIFIPLYILMCLSIPDKADYDTDNATDIHQYQSLDFVSWISQPATKIIIGLTFIVLIVYTLWQIYWMSKYGQSIGKRILKIWVIRTNGENPGFARNVILRELIYQILVIVFSLITFGIGYFVFMLVPAMVFIKKWNRRTFQDFMAGTIVVSTKNTVKDERIRITLPK